MGCSVSAASSTILADNKSYKLYNITSSKVHLFSSFYGIGCCYCDLYIQDLPSLSHPDGSCRWKVLL